jgi:uncharacterized protein (TIGR03437 family)
MRKLLFLVLLATLAGANLRADSMHAPVLQWYKTVSGSGTNAVAAVGSDTQGNLYIAGNTTALDFPTTAAAQSKAGGSPVTRIDTASGSFQRLYTPGLAAASSITIDPQNSNILYATAAGTLMRSSDGGNNWIILPAFPSVVTINSVTVDPSNSNNLYAGTSPLGTFKSTDGGASWTAINNGIPSSYNLGTNALEFNVYQIWIDPKSPNVLFAYSGPHLYRSADAGANWALTLSPAIFYGTLAFDPFTPGTIYVRGQKSTDEGQSWIPFTAPGASPGGQVIPDPLHPGTLYSLSFGDGIYQSSDAGATWNLKLKGPVNFLEVDLKQPVLYTYVQQLGIVKSTDGFSTYVAIGPSAMVLAGNQLRQLKVAGSFVFAVAAPANDVFVAKLDPNGNILYSTYFGGSSADTAVGMAVGSDGSVYVTGQTSSADFPVTAGAYATALTITAPTLALFSNFVFKLNPDGSLAWSTYFATYSSTVSAIAVDAGGSPYLAGTTGGGLPTTAGAYQEKFTATNPCFPGMIGPCVPPSEAFLTKLDAKGSTLTFSTYLGNDLTNGRIFGFNALALDPTGNAYLAGGGPILLMNATGSAVLKSTSQRVAFSAIALDAGGNLYATGSTNTFGTFPATPGAFQTLPQPTFPSLPSQLGPGGIGEAFVMKFDSGLSRVLAATLLGGEAYDIGQSVAVDASSGNIIVSGTTDSKAFPTRAPFQGSFAARSGFVAGFDSNLSQLLFSTYLGDDRSFSSRGAIPDGSGNILLAGSTLTAANSFLRDDPGYPFTIGNTVIANKIALRPAPAIRLDSVVNFASQMGLGLSPGESISAVGDGFGPDAQLLVDGTPLQIVSVSQNRIVAVVPTDAATSGARQVTVSSGSTSSNAMYMPSAPASPGIYSVDGSGFGQGYILNADGTPNSPSNPTTAGAPITIFATGVGPFTTVNGYAVTDLPVAVFVDGFYANGIAAVMKQVPGQPGNVYEIGVYVPDPASLAAQNPDLKNFKFPPQVPVTMILGGVGSQRGIALSVK